MSDGEWELPPQHDISAIIKSWYSTYMVDGKFSPLATSQAIANSLTASEETRGEMGVWQRMVADPACASDYDDLDRFDAWLKSLREEIDGLSSWEGASESLMQKVDSFWGRQGSAPKSVQDFSGPAFVYPYIVANACRVDIKTKVDAVKEIPEDLYNNPILNFLTSPAGFALVILGGVIVARNLTK